MTKEKKSPRASARSEMAREICLSLQLFESRPFYLDGKSPSSVRPYLTREAIKARIRIATAVIDDGRSLLVTRIE